MLCVLRVFCLRVCLLCVFACQFTRLDLYEVVILFIVCRPYLLLCVSCLMLFDYVFCHACDSLFVC